MDNTVEELTFDDVANAEVEAIQAHIEKTEDEERKIIRRIERSESDLRRVHRDLEELWKSFHKAKKQVTELKKFVWKSNNPNMVALRNEILLAAKLIKDSDETNSK